MFIKVIYKDDPELFKLKRNSSDTDLSEEKHVLVNPDCYVRIMLEYIRNHCKLGEGTNFDLCDESGILKGLYSMPTYINASEMFENKKSYYVVVLKLESDRQITILPQVNRQSKLYQELKSKVSSYLQAQDSSSHVTTSSIGPKGSKNK